jgi:magnesium transporter
MIPWQKDLAPPKDIVWIDLCAPSHSEIRWLEENYRIPLEFLLAPLDYDETPRYEVEDHFTLIIIRASLHNEEEVSEQKSENENSFPGLEEPYFTSPLGIIIDHVHHLIITISPQEEPILNEFLQFQVKGFDPTDHTHFILLIFYRTTLRYLRHLRDIDNEVTSLEKQLRQKMNNAAILTLLDYQKSLVYFATALRNHQFLFERLKRSRLFAHLPEEDLELLEDIIIDTHQAIETTQISLQIYAKMSDAFGSIINNNLNNVMKSLTIITVVLSVPILISGIYGMNITLPLQDHPNAFLLILLFALVITIIAYRIITIRFRF